MNDFTILQMSQAIADAGLGGVTFQELKSAAILNALGRCRGNRTHVANELGISVRTLQRKLKSNGLVDRDGGVYASHARCRVLAEPQTR